MKKNIFFLFCVCITAVCNHACTDDYLTDVDNSTSISSAVYVAPDWNAETYTITIPGAGNASFTLEEIPRWLKVESKSGQFVDGTAYIVCAAITDSEFSQTGVYNSTMKITVEGKGSYIMRVGYVNASNPQIKCPQSIYFDYQGERYLEIQSQNEGILIWQIVKHPEWLTVSDSMGISRYGGGHVTVRINPETIPVNDDSGEIWIANNSTNSPLCIVHVNYKAGDPSFNCDAGVDFGREENNKNLNIYNSGNGTLSWKIEEAPEWITVSPQQGLVSSYSGMDINLSCNRALLSNGNHTGAIVFSTNDKEKPFYSITVKCRIGTGNSENITAIEGTVIDVEYDTASGIIYMAIHAPNKLIAYDTKTSQFISEILLDRAPTCLNISKDEQYAVVGHGGWITYIDLTNKTVLKKHAIEFTVFDAVWVDRQWCCLTPDKDQWVDLHWLNLETGVDYVNPDYSSSSIREKTTIKMLDDKTIIGGYYNNLYIINIEQKKLEKQLRGSFDGFWLTQDLSYLINKSGYVYRVPTINSSNDLNSIGKLQFQSDSYSTTILHLDHCSATNCLWGIVNTDVWNEKPTSLYYFEATDYTFIKSYFYDDYYTTINGVANVYETSARYVFSNQSGTEIYVIKNVAKKYNANAWSMETISVK